MANSGYHIELYRRLPYIIFNLERPLSCEYGTQCRFKAPHVRFPRCWCAGTKPGTCAVGWKSSQGNVGTINNNMPDILELIDKHEKLYNKDANCQWTGGFFSTSHSDSYDTISELHLEYKKFSESRTVNVGNVQTLKRYLLYTVAPGMVDSDAFYKSACGIYSDRKNECAAFLGKTGNGARNSLKCLISKCSSRDECPFCQCKEDRWEKKRNFETQRREWMDNLFIKESFNLWIKAGHECPLDVYDNLDGEMCEPGSICYRWEDHRNPGLYSSLCTTCDTLCSDTSLGEENAIFSPFLNPTTVPLRGYKFINYLTGIMGIQEELVFGLNAENSSCKVSSDKKLQAFYRFYASLQNGNPAAGKKFVADEAELQAKLNELTDFLNNNANEACFIFDALQCVATTAGMDDGTCQRTFNEIIPHSEAVWDRHWGYNGIKEKKITDKNVDRRLEHEPSECSPQVSSSSSPTVGFCPGFSVCYEDLSDNSVLYSSDCDLPSSYTPRYVCHNTLGGEKLGTCEVKVLKDRILESRSNIVDMGEACSSDDQVKLYNIVRIGDDKFLYYYLSQSKLSEASRKSFCDRTKLLTCVGDICTCVNDTQPRTTNSNGQSYNSAYCYLTKGPCDGDVTNILKDLVNVTITEREDMEQHYGKPNHDWTPDCTQSNLCVYIHPDTGVCTDVYLGDWEPRGGNEFDKDGRRRRNNAVILVTPDASLQMLMTLTSILFASLF